MNKSFITNFIALGIICLGYVSPYYPEHLLSIGYFSFSGAITNWLAIYMLFEKVPFLYGSGVIPSRFEEFKIGIKSIIMQQFFTKANLAKFFGTQADKIEAKIDFDTFLVQIDYKVLYNKLVDAIMSSPLGSMLQMFGGKEALAPVEEQFIIKMREGFKEIVEAPKFQSSLREMFVANTNVESILSQVESIVDQRLQELTPKMVKEIISKMIKTHLGWLVVWGGVFGAIIGLLSSLFKVL